jgi:protease-4
MRDFLKQILATLLALCIFMGLSLGGLLTVILVLASSSKDSAPTVENQSVLTIDMAQSIPDVDRTLRLQDVFTNAKPDSLTLRSVVQAIDIAAQDPHILAVYLYSRNTAVANPTGYANLKEVREALQRFRQSGKKIYAYDMDWQEREYYLASVADQIAINPMGSLELNGFSSETTFFAGALQKFGIGMQAIWQGKYKSAVEPFLRSQRSDASRQQTEKLLNDLWGEFAATTSQGRQLKPEQLQEIANSKGYLTAADAQQAKLIDRTAYVDEILDQLKQLTGEDKDSKSFRQISLGQYITAVDDQINPRQGGKVAVVYADGEIVNGQGELGQIGGDHLARQLRALRLDDEVKALVLRVNSPGGSATAADVIQREVILTQKVKPVVVSMGNVAASGGYWISTYANRILAESNTITGSIGVFGLQPNIQKLANSNGITWDVVKTSQFSDSRTLTRPKTPEEIAVIQRIVRQIYDQFLTKVAQSRQLERPKVAEIAQGRVWSGQQAKNLGLVDEIGGLEAAIAAAAKLAHLGDKWHVEEFPKTTTLEAKIIQQLLGSRLQTQGSPQDALSQFFHVFEADLKTLQLMNDPRGIYLRMPENLRIQ